MTLVVAEKTAGGIIVGSDRNVTTPEGEIYEYGRNKVVIREGYLFGHCGSARVGQALEHYVNLPEIPPEGDLLPFLSTKLVPAIRKAVTENGAAYEGRLILGEKAAVLVGCRGELFHITSDLVAVRVADDVAAIGSGRHHAYGALYALRKIDYGTPRERLEIALEASARYKATIRGPWDFLELRKP